MEQELECLAEAISVLNKVQKILFKGDTEEELEYLLKAYDLKNFLKKCYCERYKNKLISEEDLKIEIDEILERR